MLEYSTASWTKKQDKRVKPLAPRADQILIAVRLLIISLLFVVPWYYGTVAWTTQYFFLIYALTICTVAFALLFLRKIAAKSKPDEATEFKLLPPLPTFIFVALGFWSLLQSLPLYSISGGDTGPYSVRIQRFFLGENTPSIADQFARAESQTDDLPTAGDNSNLPEPTLISNDLKEHKLSWSIDPLNTRAAVGMIFLTAALIWLGHAYFSNAYSFVWLLTAVTVIGVAVGMFGIAGLLDFRPTNLLGLGKQSSFGPFVSRNSGGCYMNICLAASLGLTTVAFSMGGRKRSDRRYSSLSETRWENFLSKIETSIGQLTTFQIASVIATAVLMSAVVSTASRGAAIAGALAVLAVFLISTGRGMTIGRLVIAVAVILVGCTFLFWFELDDHLRERLQNSLWEEEAENGRRLIWSVASTAASYFFSTGSGLGSFHFAHLPFQTTSVNIWFYHAENLYLEALVELGWIGAIAIVGIIAIFIKLLMPNSLKTGTDETWSNRLGASRITALAMLVSVGVHSLFDFSMICPACFVTAALLFGAIYGCSESDYRIQRMVSKKMPSRRRLRNSKSSSIPSKPEEDQGRQTAYSETTVASVIKHDSSPKEPLRRVKRELNVENQIGKPAWTLAAMLAFILIGMMAYSLPHLELISRGEQMRQFVQRQYKLPEEKRATNRSFMLAGIWGDDEKKLYDCPEALRYLALSFIEDYQRIRSDSLQEEFKLEPREANAMSTLTVGHGSLRKLKNEPGLIDQFFISTTQKELWSKARSMLQSTLIGSPLDWRTSYLLFMLSYDLPEKQLNELINRLRQVSKHRPGHLLQLAIIEKEFGREKTSLDFLSTTIEGRPDLAVPISKLLATWYDDTSVPLKVFKPEPYILLQILPSFPKDKFPITHEQVLLQAKTSTEALSRVDLNRAIYLSTIEREQGNFEKALEYLLDASQRRINDVSLRFEVIHLAIKLERFDIAEEEISRLRFLSSDEARLDAYQKAIDNAKAAAEKR